MDVDGNLLSALEVAALSGVEVEKRKPIPVPDEELDAVLAMDRAQRKKWRRERMRKLLREARQKQRTLK